MDEEEEEEEEEEKRRKEMKERIKKEREKEEAEDGRGYIQTHRRPPSASDCGKLRKHSVQESMSAAEMSRSVGDRH